MNELHTADRDYFTRLYGQYHRLLYAYAYNKVKDVFLAEEIVQDTFIRFWRQRERNVDQLNADPRHFLFFIAKTLLVDHYRQKKQPVLVDVALAIHEPSAENMMDQKHEALHFKTLVREAAAMLPERQRQIFEMNYFEELQNDEIAGILNISRQTVKNLLVKAMKQVRRQLSSQFLSSFTGLL